MLKHAEKNLFQKTFLWNDLEFCVDSKDANFLEDMTRVLIQTAEHSTDTVAKVDTAAVRPVIGCHLHQSLSKDLPVEIENVVSKVEKAEEAKEGYFFVYPDRTRSNEIRFSCYIRGKERWQRFGDTILYLEQKEMDVFRVISDEPPSYSEVILLLINPLFFLLQLFGYFRVHACCVSKNSKGLLIPGFSTSGKSTAGFALLQNGFDLLHDESVLLKNNVNGYSAYRLTSILKVRVDSVRRFFSGSALLQPLLTRFALEEEELMIPFDQIDSPCAAITKIETIVGVAILNKTNTAGSKVIPEHPMKLLPALFTSVLSCVDARMAEEKFSFLIKLLQTIPAFRVDFGTDMRLFSEQIGLLFHELEG